MSYVQYTVKKYFLAVAVSLFLCLTSYGQNAGGVKVSGQLTDSTGAAVQDANIVFGGKGSSRTTYAVSDANGAFSVTLPAGKYSIGITHISYKDIVEALNITADTTLSYRLTANSNKLSEVKVYGDFIKRKGASFTAKVRGNPLAEDRSVLSFMNMLPGIRGLSVNGRSATVYVNGRELKMPQDELVRYLSSIPTESIEDISAKAAKGAGTKASGAAGVINITLRKSSAPRYSGQVLFSPSLNLQTGKSIGSLGTSAGYFDKKLSSLTSLNLTKISEKKTTENMYDGRREMSESNRNEYVLIFDQSLFYDINQAHSLGIGLNFLLKPDYKNSARYYGDVSSPFDKDISLNKNREDIFLNYKYVFGKRKSSWNIKADILSDESSHSEKYENQTNAYGTSYKDAYLNYGFQSNLRLCLTEDAELSIGSDYVSADAKRKYNTPFSNTIDKFKFRENTFGTYAEFYTPLSALELTVGLRYEHNFTRMTNAGDPSKYDKLWDNDVLPSADISYNGKNYSASLSYDRSINRSNMYYYAPSVSYDGEFIIEETGVSPFVRPTYSNNLSLSQTFANAHTLGLSYSWTKDEYEVSYVKDGDYIKKIEAPEGLRKDYKAFYMSNLWLVKNKLYGVFNISGTYSNMDKHDFSEHCWLMSSSLSMTYYLPNSWRVRISGSYSSPDRTSSYEMSAFWSGDIAVSKSIGKNWRFELTGGGLLHNKKMKMTSRVPGVDYVCRSSWNVSSIEGTLVYKFNNFRGKRASNIRELRSKTSK